MFDNYIGNFRFVSLAGGWEPPFLQLGHKQRVGIDGSLLFVEGYKGREFSVETAVDAVDLAAAETEFISYGDLIGAGTVNLERNGISSLAHGFAVAVLAVRKIRTNRLRIAVGGLHPPGLGLLVAEWRLVSIAL